MPGPVVPPFARRNEFVPVAGGHLIMDLSGERVRCEVLEADHPDVAIVRILSIVTGKHGHHHKQGDVLCAQRSLDNLGIECWFPVDERAVMQREDAQRAAEREIERRAPPPPAQEMAADAPAPEAEKPKRTRRRKAAA